MIKEALTGKEITAKVQTYPSQESQIIALAPIQSLGWVVGAGRPEEEVMLPSSLIFSIIQGYF